MASQKSKSVLFVCTAASPGGMERVVLDLARAFTTRGWHARAVFPSGSASDGFTVWADAQGVEYEVSDCVLDAAAVHSRGDMFKLRAFIASDKPDIVHFHYGSSFVSIYDILGAKLAGLSRVYATLHQAVPWEDLEPRKKSMTGLCGKWLLTRVFAICSQSVQLFRQAGILSHKTSLIYCGVCPPVKDVTQNAAREQLGVPANAFVVLSVASLTKRKGIDDLINAVAQIPDSTNNLRLVIAGDGPERNALEIQAHEMIPGKALFLGRITGDMSAIYASADVFVLASHAEGVPLVCHEASLAGLPTIATDVGGTSEAIVDGVTGILVQDKSPDQIARAIQVLRDSPEKRKEMGQSAKKRALDEFTDSAMADLYEQEFNR